MCEIGNEKFVFFCQSHCLCSFLNFSVERANVKAYPVVYDATDLSEDDCVLVCAKMVLKGL